MAIRKLKLSVSLSRGHSNKGSFVSLQLRDDDSMSSIRIEMTPEKLGSILAGDSQELMVEFYNPQNFGKKRIRKSIKHTFKHRQSLPYESDKRDALVQALAEPYEKDGWIFAGPRGTWSQSDSGYDGKKRWVMLHFVKYVAKTKKSKEQSNVDSSK